MSHKDAPPETPSQIACREWWTNAQPHVTRAWGRAKNGAFLAEESRLLHAAWEHARVPDEWPMPRQRPRESPMSSMTLEQVRDRLRTEIDPDSLWGCAQVLADAIDAHIGGMGEPVTQHGKYWGSDDQTDEIMIRLDQVGELLAIIHGDGGHYLAEHGQQNAAKSAQAKVIWMMERLAAASPIDLAAVRVATANIREWNDKYLGGGDLAQLVGNLEATIKVRT